MVLVVLDTTRFWCQLGSILFPPHTQSLPKSEVNLMHKSRYSTGNDPCSCVSLFVYVILFLSSIRASVTPAAPSTVHAIKQGPAALQHLHYSLCSRAGTCIHYINIYLYMFCVIIPHEREGSSMNI